MVIRDSVYIALFAAIIVGLGAFPPITIPAVGVPITAQSLGVMLAGGILGAKRGALALVLFLVLVAIGLPLLSGGRGGFAVFASASGGFLISWIVGAYMTGLLVEKFWAKLSFEKALFATVIGGIVVVYSIGVPWVAVVAKISFTKAFVGSIAFVPGDIVKALIAAAVIVVVKKSYPIISKNS